MVFVDFFAGGGGSTTAAVTLDAVADESMKMAEIVWQGPRLGFVAETGRFVAMYSGVDALNTIFLLLCLASYFSFFVFLFFLFLILSCIPVCLSSSYPVACAAAICYSSLILVQPDRTAHLEREYVPLIGAGSVATFAEGDRS